MKKSTLIILILVVVLFTAYYQFPIRLRTGLGEVKKLPKSPQIKIVFSRKQKAKERVKITDSDGVVKEIRKLWSDQMEVREEFIVVHLDRGNRILGYHQLGSGGIVGVVADVRLLLATAIKSLATAIILVHNHPSGNLVPSTADIRLTKNVQEVARVHKIDVLDHIIITREDYFSFTDNDLL